MVKVGFEELGEPTWGTADGLGVDGIQIATVQVPFWRGSAGHKASVAVSTAGPSTAATATLSAQVA